MEINELKAIIEGILFASGDEGVTVKQLMDTLDLPKDTVVHLLEELTYDYEHPGRGIRLLKARDFYHLTTKPEHTKYLKKMLESPQTNRLSQAALEVLAIIAYQQPITRIEIEEIRGVNSQGPLQTLISRSLIEEVGRKDAVGRPILFGTTKDFLTFFGLTSIDELPPLKEDFKFDQLQEEVDLYDEHFQNID